VHPGGVDLARPPLQCSELGGDEAQSVQVLLPGSHAGEDAAQRAGLRPDLHATTAARLLRCCDKEMRLGGDPIIPYKHQLSRRISRLHLLAPNTDAVLYIGMGEFALELLKLLPFKSNTPQLHSPPAHTCFKFQ
jgi:hypothetical protein